MQIVTTHRQPVGATSTPESSQPPWRTEMKRAVRDPVELCKILNISDDFVEPARRAAASFPLFAPHPFINRMRTGDPADPLLLQVLPLEHELTPQPGFVTDPVEDGSATVVSGMLHKYPGRVLFITTGACAIHCRYCFRRHFPYSGGPKSPDAWNPAFDAIASDTSIHEVILSGGDPLTISDENLKTLVARIAEIQHVKRLRIHSRLPIVIPSRVTSELIEWMRFSRLATYMVIHMNHPSEIDDATASAIERLVEAGIPVLNQAVLLKGVNDQIETLATLCERLSDLRVIPYYLHQLDRVFGAAHFEVNPTSGVALLAQLRNRLPGFAVPRYVREIAGEQSKTPISE